MNTDTTNIPLQRVTLSAKNKKWREDTVKGIIGMCNFSPNHDSRENLHKCYEYYAGTIDQQDYAHVLKPYGQVVKNFPAKLQNYNIIKPVIDLLLGEKSKRPFNYTVAVKNPDAVTIKDEQKKAKIFENLKRQFLKELEASGAIEEGYAGPQPLLPEEEAELFDRTYKDQRAIVGQNALSFLEQYLEIPRKFRKGFFHFLVSGMVISHHDVEEGDPIYHIENPLNVDYDKSPDLDFIEDGQWAVVRKMYTPSQVIDGFWRHLTPEEVQRISDYMSSSKTSDHLPLNTSDLATSSRPHSHSSTRLIEVIRVYWKSLARHGVVEYIDEMGIPQKKDVEDGYELQIGEKVKWYWKNEVWRGTMIDTDIFIDIRPNEVQRRSLDNPSICKLPINGRRYSDINTESISLAMLGIPFQLMYNIFKYRLEIAVAKAKDMIAQIDKSGIPEDMSMDEFLYYMSAFGIAWSDSSQEGYNPPATHAASIDLTAKTIRDHIELCAMVVEEWFSLSGVTRQRLGETSPYELKGTTQQSIIQSSHITEDLFMKYEEFEERDLQALMDNSKLAWINGKKAVCVLPDWSEHHFEIDGIEHMETEYGVFVTSSGKERDKIEALRALGQYMVSGGYSMSAIATLLESENFSQIKAAFEKAERSMKEAEEAQRQHEQQLQEMAAAAAAEQREWEGAENEKDRENKIDVAKISHSSDSTSSPGTNNASIEIQKLMLDKKDQADSHGIELQKLDLERDKLSTDAELKREEIKVKRIAANKPVSKSK